MVVFVVFFFFFKQKTAYAIGTGDCSLDVCASALTHTHTHTHSHIHTHTHTHITHTHTHTHIHACRAGHTVKSEDLHGDKTLLELRRVYHCMAYNMLVSVITCTQSKMQFYTGFLFKEDITKVDG